MKDTAQIMSYMDGFEEIYNDQISTLATKLTTGEISKKEFDEEYDRLNSKEYIRSVAPEFCSEDIINMYDKAENSFNTAQKVAQTTGIIAGAGVATTVLTFGIFDTMKKKA